ncbi:MAG: hypothetical protein IPJ77_03105 [Planctomycetes bacterium]|nr:hypothetical protein [Planctomycetota bacterium]
MRLAAEGALAAAGFGPRTNGALTASANVGRKPLYELVHGSEHFLVRRFSHGGLLRWVTGRRFRDPRRPFRELVLAERLRALGLATPEVVAARATRAGLGWELDLVPRRVPDSIDLGHVLAAARAGALPRVVVRRLVVALGRFVAKLHAADFVHADLTPNNVLVNRDALAGAEPELCILDLDRSRFVAALDDETRRDNLRRLLRFVERRERRGALLGRADYARFCRAYDAGGERWKDDWRAIHARHTQRSSWHRAGWWLEERLAPRTDPREDAPRTRSTDRGAS